MVGFPGHGRQQVSGGHEVAEHDGGVHGNRVNGLIGNTAMSSDQSSYGIRINFVIARPTPQVS